MMTTKLFIRLHIFQNKKSKISLKAITQITKFTSILVNNDTNTLLPIILYPGAIRVLKNEILSFRLKNRIQLYFGLSTIKTFIVDKKFLFSSIFYSFNRFLLINRFAQEYQEERCVEKISSILIINQMLCNFLGTKLNSYQK